MNKICDNCTHQEIGNRDIQCGEARYSNDMGYGSFKQGSKCIHDKDLSDCYSQRTGSEISISNQAAVLKNIKKERDALRNEVYILKERLIKINNLKNNK